jgi:hypothetical protein
VSQYDNSEAGEVVTKATPANIANVTMIAATRVVLEPLMNDPSRSRVHDLHLPV